MPPQNQTQYDPSQLSKDMDFRNAPTAQKIAYLSSVDPEFAKAQPHEQAGYINHILGNDVPTQFEKDRQGAFNTDSSTRPEAFPGANSVPGADTAGRVGDALTDAAKHPRAVLNAAGEFGKSAAMGLPGAARTALLPSEAASTAISRGRQLLASDTAEKASGRSPVYRALAAVGRGEGAPVDQMEHAADIGSPAGVVGAAGTATAAAAGPSLVGAAARASLPVRVGLAQKIVQPLVYEGVGEAGADTRMGIEPERGIVKEGIWGTRGSMQDQINQRLSLLKPAANNKLSASPGSPYPLNATDSINSAVDDAITQANKNGQGSVVPRLEELRQSLLTKHGNVQGKPLDINNLKTSIQDTARQLGAFKNTVPAEASAASAAGQASSNIRSQVNDAVPEAAPLNERMADLIDARSGLARGAEASKGKPIFGGSGEGATSRVLNSTVGAPLVRSGAARLISLGAKEGIPPMQSVLPPPVPPPVGPPPVPTQTPFVPPAPVEQVPPTGPGENVALFPDIPSGQAPSPTQGAGEVPNWPPKVGWDAQGATSVAPPTFPPVSSEAGVPVSNTHGSVPTTPEPSPRGQWEPESDYRTRRAPIRNDRQRLLQKGDNQ